MKKLFLALIASLILLPAYSQYVVKGKIMDPENAVMPMVNVAFLNQMDSTLVSGAVSDSCGIYSTSLAEGNYIIRYSYLGYKTLYKKMQVNADRTLPVVRMEASQTTLKEVEVTAYRKPFKLDRDGLLADVENTILAKQTNLNDLLCIQFGAACRHRNKDQTVGGWICFQCKGQSAAGKPFQTELSYKWQLQLQELGFLFLLQLQPGKKQFSA